MHTEILKHDVYKFSCISEGLWMKVFILVSSLSRIVRYSYNAGTRGEVKVLYCFICLLRIFYLVFGMQYFEYVKFRWTYLLQEFDCTHSHLHNNNILRWMKLHLRQMRRELCGRPSYQLKTKYIPVRSSWPIYHCSILILDPFICKACPH